MESSNVEFNEDIIEEELTEITEHQETNEDIVELVTAEQEKKQSQKQSRRMKGNQHPNLK